MDFLRNFGLPEALLNNLDHDEELKETQAEKLHEQTEFNRPIFSDGVGFNKCSLLEKCRLHSV